MFIVVGRVAPAKGDPVVSEGDQSMVGDGYTMGIATEVLENIFRAAEGGFRVDDPVFSEQRS